MSLYYRAENESNDTITTANTIPSLYSGDEVIFYGSSNANTRDYDWFKFTAHTTGYASISIDGTGMYSLALCDRYGNPISSEYDSENPSLTAYVTSNSTYYIWVAKHTLSTESLSWTGLLSMPGASSTPSTPSTPSTSNDKPDLSISSFSLSDSSISQDKSVTLSFLVDNYGAAESPESEADIYIDDTYFGSIDIPSLSTTCPGWYVPVSYNIPANTLSAGSHSIRIKADGDDSIDESDESDNWSSTEYITVTSAAKPNLDVDTYSVSSSNIRSDQTLTLTFDVNNRGDASCGSSYAYIYDGSNYLGSVNVGYLAAHGNGTWYRTCTYTIAAGTLSGGSHSICIKADGGNTIAESDESDNTICRTVNVTQVTRDLKITDMQVSDNSITTAQSTVFTFKVVNNGNTAVGTTKLYLKAGNTILREVSVGAIAAGASRNCQITLTSGKLPVGTHRVYATADAANQITETNENNNSAYRTITVSRATRDLKISDMQVSNNSITTAQATVFTFKVVNNGNTAVGTTKLYLKAGNTILREVSVGAIAAGASRNCRITLPSGKLSIGTHKIYVTADAANQVSETDETNNSAYRTIFVKRPVRDLKISDMNISNGNRQNASGQFKFTFKVTNNGNTSVGTTKLYVYDDDRKIRELSLDTVNAGQTRNCTLTVNAATLGVGTHRIRIKVDGASQISESNENNNSAYRTVFVDNVRRSADIPCDEAKIDCTGGDIGLWKDDRDNASLPLLAGSDDSGLLSWDSSGSTSDLLTGAVCDSLTNLTGDEESKSRAASTLLA